MALAPHFHGPRTQDLIITCSVVGDRGGDGGGGGGRAM